MVPVGEREVEADAQPSARNASTNSRTMSRPYGACMIEKSRRLRVPHREAVVVLGREHGVLHAGALRQPRPLARVVRLRVERGGGAWYCSTVTALALRQRGIAADSGHESSMPCCEQWPQWMNMPKRAVSNQVMRGYRTLSAEAHDVGCPDGRSAASVALAERNRRRSQQADAQASPEIRAGACPIGGPATSPARGDAWIGALQSLAFGAAPRPRAGVVVRRSAHRGRPAAAMSIAP